MGVFAGVIRAPAGIQVGAGAVDLGGGVGVIGLDDAAVVPTSNPTNGVILYATGGALVWRDPSGVVRGVSTDTTKVPLAGGTMTGDLVMSGAAVTSPTVRGSASSGGGLMLSSTSHATKGKINLGGSSAYDEATARLGIGTASPGVALDVVGSAAISADLTVNGDLTVTGIGQTRTIPKGIAETRTSTTLSNDGTLTATVVAGATYEVTFVLLCDGGATGDTQTAWSVPAGSTGLKACWGPSPTAKATTTPGFNDRTNTAMRSAGHGFTTAVTYSQQATSNGIAILEKSLIGITTSGSVTLQWAQVAADVTGTAMYGSSYMMITRTV